MRLVTRAECSDTARVPRLVARLLPPMSLRSHLLALVLVTLVPVLGFTGVLVAAFAHHERATIERGSRETARALAAAVDEQINAAFAALSALALSNELLRGDLREFYEEARLLRATQEGWETIFLHDAEGTGLLNVRLAFGAPVPSAAGHEPFTTLMASGQPAVSDLAHGRVVQRPVVR